VTTYLFVGPTLPVAEIGALCDFVCLPPAAQGDVFHLVKARPRAIGIIDGYFDGVPAVWHKEVLWALTQGVHVFGSASMGALRGAELHSFGMRGVGSIFEAYRSGELEDDDEVAILHAPAEAGYVGLSEPMVNIRATLDHAENAGIIAATSRAMLIERAKALFYQDRSWQRILRDSDPSAPLSAELRRLEGWLPAGRIDRKGLDARAMIAAMQAFLAGNPAPVRTTFKFEWTDMWDVVAGSPPARGAVAGDAGGGTEEDWVLDELRLDEAAFESTRQRALLRRLARDRGAPQPRNLDIPALRASEQRLRARLGLFRQADVERWCGENGLDPTDFERLIEDQARLATIEVDLDGVLARDLLDQLKLDGDYVAFRSRARNKRAALAAGGFEDASPIDCGLTPIALVAWHFEARVGRDIPDDLATYVRHLGLAKPADFYRVLAREWLYSQRGMVGADRK
jgi:hypothetical protein